MFIYTDFHSHILPHMDDGAKTKEEAQDLIKMLKTQGIKDIYATPHYISSSESVESFLGRRERAFEEVKALIGDFSRHIHLGAEILFFPGLYNVKDLKKLRMGNLEYIMIEIPYGAYINSYNDEIEGIYYETGLKPIIAHIDRYIDVFTAKDYDKLFSIHNAVFQLGVDIVDCRRTKKLVKNMVKNEIPLIFGSDTHNTDKRAPAFDKLYSSHFFKQLVKKLSYMDEFEDMLSGL